MNLVAAMACSLLRGAVSVFKASSDILAPRAIGCYQEAPLQQAPDKFIRVSGDLVLVSFEVLVNPVHNLLPLLVPSACCQMTVPTGFRAYILLVLAATIIASPSMTRK